MGCRYAACYLLHKTEIQKYRQRICASMLHAISCTKQKYRQMRICAGMLLAIYCTKKKYRNTGREYVQVCCMLFLAQNRNTGREYVQVCCMLFLAQNRNTGRYSLPVFLFCARNSMQPM